MILQSPLKLFMLGLCFMILSLSSADSAAAKPDIFQRDQIEPYPDTRFARSMILIDAGHGGIDGGTSYKDILEKHINLAIGQKLYLLLESKGIPAVLNRTGDYALSEENRWSVTRSRHKRDLAQRYQLSEELPIKVYVSLHVNWNRREAARGAVVLHQEEGRSKLLASIIQDHLNQLYPRHPHNTEIGNAYYLLRRVQQPAVIVETGFISNAEDRELLTSTRGQTLIAEKICDAIMEYLTLYH